MKLRFTRLGIAASAIGHLSALAAVLIYADVHPFDPLAAEPIPVDIILPEEAAPAPKAPEPSPTPTVPPPDSFDLSSKSAPAVQPPPAAPPPPPQPAQQPKQQTKQPASSKQAAAAPPPPPPPTPAASPSPLPSPVPAAPEPDLSIKYHVMLGLPPQTEAGGFDAPEKTAEIGTGPVAEFRRHLKTCSRLPQSVAPSDTVKVTLRVFMTPDGRLARAPLLVEASASAKGPALMQSAIAALLACQPYAMLPADKYGEWKVLDLNFTPQDFSGG